MSRRNSLSLVVPLSASHLNIRTAAGLTKLWVSTFFAFLLICQFCYQVLPIPTVAGDSNPLWRYTWCSWTEWSRCAPVNCQNEVSLIDSSEGDSSQWNGVAEIRNHNDDDPTSYCVVQPTERSRRVVRTAVVQSTQGGVRRERTPMKRRQRLCKCKSLSILGFLGPFGKDKCLKRSREVNCAPCGVDEIIYPYQDPDRDVSPLRMCDPVLDGPLQLYKIIGGIAGGVILILFICWLIRIVGRLWSRSTRTGDRRTSDYGPDGRRFRPRPGMTSSRGDASSRRQADQVTGPADGAVDTALHDEMPPAYKDVVNILPNIQFAGPKPPSGVTQDDASLVQFFRGLHKPTARRTGRPTQRNSLDAGQAGSSNQTLDQPSDTPPPPSYEDVVSTGLETHPTASLEHCDRQTTRDEGQGAESASTTTSVEYTESDVHRFFPMSLRLKPNQSTTDLNPHDPSAPPL